MNLKITKADFDKAVPAAREPKGKIFEVLQPAIEFELSRIESEILGAAGTAAVESGTDDLLCQKVIRLACLRAFISEMRSLDLVLTATGFGVVSTQDTAPASKQRVDALEVQLRRNERNTLDIVLGGLFRVDGWHNQPQRRTNVQTLFFSMWQLEHYAGISNPTPADWDASYPLVLDADAYLRKHISDEYMDELIEQMTSATITTDNDIIMDLCCLFIGAWVKNDHSRKGIIYARIINRMEAYLSRYPAYAQSEAYRLNHFTPYENHEEDGAFHFVG